MSNIRFNLVYAVIAVLGILFFRSVYEKYQEVAIVPYSEFQKLLHDKKLEEITITNSSIQGKLKAPIEGGKTRIMTARVEPLLAADCDKYDVKYTGVVENNFLSNLLSWIVPTLLFFGIWAYLMRRMNGKMGAGGGLMAIGKSKAKVFVEDDTRVTFADVAGVDEGKAELEETVNFLKDPKSYSRLGAHMPKGVLLVGPPGTGKTLLARAVAGEAGVPFFSISGSEFVEMFVGVGAARVRDLFEQARSKAPCIIFIDELDALGRARNAVGGFGGNDEKEQTLNQLLVELDGFDPTSGIVLLAATNRPEILDPALLRAGRFDRQIVVDRPDKIGRAQILRVHARKVQLDPAVKLDEVAALTPGFTGADLANLVNEAALTATRRRGKTVTQSDFTVALERLVAGLEKRSRVLSPTERRIVAYHEMGHAIVAASLPGADPVHKISIIPRGIGALGYTMQRPTEDRYIITRDELENKMAVLLGGRAAEQIVFGHLSTGAADDLRRATDIAQDMVMRYAMVEGLGNVSYDRRGPAFLQGGGIDPGGRDYSEETAREIDIAVRDMVDRALERALLLLQRHRAVMEEGATLLLERETLEDEHLTALQKKLVVPDQLAAATAV